MLRSSKSDKFIHMLAVIVGVASLVLDVIMVIVSLMFVLGHKADKATLVLLVAIALVSAVAFVMCKDLS